MSNLTHAEKATWEIIQENYKKIPQMSISEISDLAHVSLSTVNRTVRKKDTVDTVNFAMRCEIKKCRKTQGFQ